jgi:hypothetical protein
MDPKQAQDIRNAIDNGLGSLNVFAMQHYALLLVQCGVRRVTIFREFVIL